MFAAAGIRSNGQSAIGIYVTRSGAIRQFTDRVINTGVPIMWPGFVETRMTTGTIGFVIATRPAYRYVITFVAIDTTHTGFVVPGIVTARMIIVHRGPNSRTMALVTRQTGDKVALRLVMTGHTRRGGGAVVKGHRGPVLCDMTIIAVVGRRDMAVGLAVTTATGPAHQAMVKIHHHPVFGTVAVFTAIG